MEVTLLLDLPVPAAAGPVQRLCAGLRAELTGGAVTSVVCRADRAVADLATVDAVARLALVTRRAGVAFRLERAGAELSSLLALVGLEALLPSRDG